MDIDQYIENKLTQMQLLLHYLPWVKTPQQKHQIEEELQRIQYLINTAATVVLVNATIESSLNYETPKPQTYNTTTGDRSGSARYGKRLSGKATVAH